MLLICPNCKRLYEQGSLGTECRYCDDELLVPHTKLCDFLIEGMNDRGETSGRFLEVTSVVATDKKGNELGRYTSADALLNDIEHMPGDMVLLAVETVGDPRVDMTGRFVCDGYFSA
ncbi:MAG: hypothetical protein K2R98_19310 [Gemmataceae bacterium]|nr:hypothetical protein [Gemmataceae bacterium]